MATYKDIKTATTLVLEEMAAEDVRLTKGDIFNRVRNIDPNITEDEDDRVLFTSALSAIIRRTQIRVDSLLSKYYLRSFYVLETSAADLVYAFVDNMTDEDWDNAIGLITEKRDQLNGVLNDISQYKLHRVK